MSNLNLSNINATAREPGLKVTEAAVGIMQLDNGMVLLGERPVGKPWEGYWEFP
ncbi:MAG: DNA mismatch repair protein MutT, partial [Methylotenera sp.]